MSMVLFFVIFFALIAIGAPMAVVFGGMSFLPGLLSSNIPYTVDAAVRSMFSSLNSFTMLAVPLFMLSGVIMARGGISKKLLFPLLFHTLYISVLLIHLRQICL